MKYTSVASFAMKTAQSSFVTENYTSKPAKSAAKAWKSAAKAWKPIGRKTKAASKNG